jgi:uncharacterized protein
LSHSRTYSIGLLVAGIVLIVGSCVPVAQTVRSVDSTPVQRLALPLDGAAASLEVPETRSAVPVVQLAPRPGLEGGAGKNLAYSFSMHDEAGGELIDESGVAPFRPVLDAAGGQPVLRVRFRELVVPAGRWTARFDAGGYDGLIRSAELQLRAPSPGVMPALMTTLVTAILGWLGAVLGALYWVRAEAARPAAASNARGEQDRLWTVACHLSALLGYILPFGHVLGPLVIWLKKRDEIASVEQTGRAVLNFQLSATLYVLAGLLLSFFLIGIAVLFAVVAFHFAMVLYASLRAQRGLEVVYPLSIRFI